MFSVSIEAIGRKTDLLWICLISEVLDLVLEMEDIIRMYTNVTGRSYDGNMHDVGNLRTKYNVESDSDIPC